MHIACNAGAKNKTRGRRSRLSLLASAILLPFISSGPVNAQAPYPSKPVTLVLATATGGLADAAARVMQPMLAERLGQPVIIENRAGAAGVIGATSVARAAPDGQTVLLNLEMHVINQVMTAKPPYDVRRDFAPVSLLARIPNMIAVPAALKVADMREFIAYAKARPGKLNFGTPGRSTSVFLLSEEFKVRTGVQMTHVPYKGGPQVIQALMTDEIQFGILSLPPFRSAIQAGTITPIAVTGDKRLADMPGVPTMIEAGYPGFISYSWIGMFVPAGTPVPVIRRLHADFVAVMADPTVRSRLIRSGFEPVASSPEELGALVESEYAHWSKVIRDAGIAVE
ncbi:MAG: tripartite tricarboxylate transporter substrate binding protein [Betaproteobacteria bacterium]|nr:tripartite tricarboxylate transporter substrate binding protein [Betaproteobacteria bacterium]